MLRKGDNRLLKVGRFILLCEGAGILGALVTYPAVVSWYPRLLKPIFTPPGWLFGPVWIVLYFLMGLALYRAWLKRARLKWFFIQLVLNILWSYLFFGLHEIGLAFIEIVVLFCAIVAALFEFERKDRLAARLLWPYLIWVGFALILNFAIWTLN